MGFDLGISEAALALGAVGSGVSAIGAISSGNAQAAESAYRAQVAQNNQVIANQNAAYAVKAGETQATTQGLRNRAVAGALRAGIAANNIDVNSGSAADVRQSQAETGVLDVETVRQNAALKAYGYRTQASGFAAEAGLDTAEAGFDTTAGLLKGAGSLLSGASSLGFKWSGMSVNNTDVSRAGESLDF